MGVLQILSNQPGAGKSTLAAALLLKLTQSQTQAAYYQPFSGPDDPGPDFIHQMLLSHGGAPATPAAQSLPAGDSGLTEAAAEIIRIAVASLQQSAAAVIVDGPSLTPDTGLTPTGAARLAEAAGAKALILFQHSPETTASEIMQTVEPFGSDLGGVALTRVTKHREEQARKGLLAELRSLGMPVRGLIPESRILQGPTVRQIAETLGARWVQEPVAIDAPVERFLIGGNIMDSGPEYYGRYDNQAVITRAQRPDIQMASLLAGTKCLVLTGGGEPTEYVKTEALQRDVPLMAVSSSTLEAAEALAPLSSLAHPRNLAKITEFAQRLDTHLDVAGLLGLLA